MNISGKLADFMSSEPEELPKFITNLNDCHQVGESFVQYRSNVNNSNENLNNSSDLVMNNEESERHIDQQDESKAPDTEDPLACQPDTTLPSLHGRYTNCS